MDRARNHMYSETAARYVGLRTDRPPPPARIDQTYRDFTADGHVKSSRHQDAEEIRIVMRPAAIPSMRWPT